MKAIFSGAAGGNPTIFPSHWSEKISVFQKIR
jgi:hypothetical protein